MENKEYKENKSYKNNLNYFLTIIVTIIVYLIIHFYGNTVREEILLEKKGYENDVSKPPINNIISIVKKDEPIDVDVNKIKLSTNKVTMKVGGKIKITAKVEPENATNKNLVWVSSDPSIAKVDSNGNVVALKEGVVTITAKTRDGMVRETCVITIKPVKIDEIKLNPTNMSLKVNTSSVIVPIIKPDEAKNEKLIWESSDPSIATVDSNGKVTGIKEGKVTITAKTKDGKVAATCVVNIVNDTIPVSKIKLDHDNLSVKVGSSSQILTTIEPENATERELVWTSSNPNVATVDNSGKITGVNVGTATITVKTKDGKVVATCEVTVEPIKVDKIILDTDKITLKLKDTKQLTATIEPDDATDKELIWTTSDPSIATVDSNGKVTGIKEGKATITVKTKDGKVVATCEVTVEPIQASKIILDNNTMTLKEKDTGQLTATIVPDNTTDKELIWTTSDPSIATVDSNGKVTGIKEGKATITVKTKDGKVVATCEVTIISEYSDLVFIYDYDDNNYIDLYNQFPTRDEVGKGFHGEKYTQDFKLKFNSEAAGVKFVITMEKLDGSNLQDDWVKAYLVHDGADIPNCYRTNGRVKTFNEYKNYNGNPNEKIIYEGTVSSTLAARGYEDYTFRMWVSEDVQLNNNSDEYQDVFSNRTFKTRINVYAFKD